MHVQEMSIPQGRHRICEPSWEEGLTGLSEGVPLVRAGSRSHRGSGQVLEEWSEQQHCSILVKTKPWWDEHPLPLQ